MSGLLDLNKRLDRLVDEVSGKAGQRKMREAGLLLQREIAAAVRETPVRSGSLSDLRMGKFGGEIGGRVVAVGNSATIAIVPDGLNSGGPLRVLESGRNLGQTGGLAGPGISAGGSTRRTKSGRVAKVRARRARRWNGYTKPLHTWTRATERIVQRAPATIHEVVVESTLGSIFGKG